jgi:di/tripeptidase
VDAGALARLERSVRAVIDRFGGSPQVRVAVEVIGDRPQAALAPNHPLVRAAQSVLRAVEGGPITREIGSTDANVPLARGIPAICVGITTGGEAHTLAEYIQTAPVVAGMRQITLLALLAAEHAAAWSVWPTADTEG